MKRRNFVTASFGCVSGLIPGLVRAATPCPPPTVSVAGGTTASTACPVTTSGAYSTNFPANENPISEGAKWVNGKVVGGSWNNIRTSSGKAFAAQFVGLSGSRYDDCIAHLNTSFTANQYAQGTVSRVAGYRNQIDKHEVELLLRFQITANGARGYEVLWGQDGELWIVRWNGPLGDYTPLGGIDNSGPNMAVDGEVLRAEIIGNVIRVYRNGSLVVTASDSTYTSGQPGIGFWPTAGSTLENYGWKSFTAGSL
jgi:hypothetical protein